MSRIQELEELIKFHRDLYYNGSAEQQQEKGISDAEYDLLELELQELDPNNDLFAEVGAEVAEEGRERLVVAMLSQEKALTEQDALKILARFDKNEPVILTEKLDGCGLDITYIDDKIVSAVTRGTWIEGTQVINQAKLIHNIPQEISMPKLAREIHVRGEVVIKWNDFKEINEEQVSRGEEEFSNPRNLAAGTIKIADLAEVKRRRLHFVAYEIFAGNNLYSMPCEDQERSYGLKLRTLASLGFDIPQTTTLMHKDLQDPVKVAYDLLENPDAYPYAIDGIVIKIDDLEKAEILGATTHHPKCSFAVKPKPEAAWVEVDHIDWTLSRTGTATPTAVFAPVQLSGASISRVNIHNLNNMEKLNVAKGTKLQIVRSGLVIPKAVKSDLGAQIEDVSSKSSEEIRLLIENLKDLGFTILSQTSTRVKYYDKNKWKSEIPATDPSTGSPLDIVELTEDGARVLRLRDNSTNYFAVAKRVEHFLKSIRVLGWGESLLVDFCKNAKVLTVRQFIDKVKEGQTEKFFTERTISRAYAQKLEQALFEGLKSVDLIAAIKGLGISHAQSVVEKVAEKFKSVEDILNPSIWKSSVTPGIYAYIEDDLKTKRTEFEDLLAVLPLKFSVSTTPKGSLLLGKSFVITGTLSRPRKEIEELIKTNGGIFQSAISSKTSFLVAGEGGGSKRSKAESLGVKVISEQDLLNMLS